MSEPPEDLSPAEKLQVAFELHQLGVDMKRAQLRRAEPSLTEAELEARLVEWLQERPGAEHGDAVGRPRPVPKEWL